ncbi:MAG: hypothetical protein ACP5MM_08115, partial [Acidithiobacillus sp.]|uniref:hypothetical protein n=1 Tax=Acidithiobacillus sp. TaxID=1872118 RepID=UPI003CFC0B32
MTNIGQSNKPRRTVVAPQPVTTSQLPPNRVLSVELDEDEEVTWTWSVLPSGEQYISGYSIVKKS